MNKLDELVKETYCLFGLAYFHSEVLHRSLCIAHAFLSFENKSHVTRARIEEKLSEAFSTTLGQIIAHIKNHFPQPVQRRLDESLDQRNYLAHHFWYDQAHLMNDEANLQKLHDELNAMVIFFDNLDSDIVEALRPIRERMGVTDELIEIEQTKILHGIDDGQLLNQRKLRKREMIVSAWLVRQAKGETTHIFETDDGVLWQLCDVGLGWTKYEKPLLSWIIDEQIQEHLPAEINPRPKIDNPWNYEFVLADGAVFWVKLSEKEHKYYCGISLGDEKTI